MDPNEMMGEFVLDAVLADEVDQLIDEPRGEGRDEKRFGMCVGCGARYSGTADECDRWRVGHECSSSGNISA